MKDYKVVAAYPHGSRDIASALKMKQDLIKAVKSLGVEIDKNHSGLAWYAIHGVEMLFTVMGPGYKSVTRTYQEGTDQEVQSEESGGVLPTVRERPLKKKVLRHLGRFPVTNHS